MRAVLILLSIVACTPPAKRPTTFTPSARTVIDTMVATYARMPSYADEGRVTVTFVGSKVRSQHERFQTSFVRDRGFRFDSHDQFANQVIWTAGGRVWNSRNTSAFQKLPSVHTYATRSSLPVRMLVPGDRFDVVDARVERTWFEDRPCWRVQGTRNGANGFVGGITLWIDVETHVLYQTEERRKSEAMIDMPAYETLATTQYMKVRVGDSIDAERLAGPNPSIVKPAGTSPWLGVALDGQLVRRVVRDGPAELAGVREGETMISLDGTPVANAAELRKIVQAKRAGDPVVALLRRDGVDRSVTVTIGDSVQHEHKRSKLQGHKAPGFTADVISGPGTLRVDELAGKVVVLSFSHATSEYLNKVHDAYAARGVRVIGVVLDGDVAPGPPARYTLVNDRGGEIADAYFASDMTIILIDRRGVIWMHLQNEILVEQVMRRLL